MLKWLFLYIPILSIASECNLLLTSRDQLRKYHFSGEKQVLMSTSEYQHYYQEINKTLSGNLSTVHRMENKWKTDFESGEEYLQKIIRQTSDSSFSKSTDNSLSSLEELVDRIRNNEFDGIAMRDPPPPKGASDKTFTYYTKPILGENGGKHQFRIRTYVREIDLSKIESEVVKGIMPNGEIAQIVKVGDRYSLSFLKKEAGSEVVTRQLFDLDEQAIIKELGGLDPPKLYAYPHGKGFKLEVKSRLPDEITSGTFENLNGKTFVQKLDLPMTMDDINFLFSKQGDFLVKLQQLKERILPNAIKKYPEVGAARVDAFFDLMKKAYQTEKNFSTLAGATEYQRFAFEVKVPDQVEGKAVAVQTTLDYNSASRYVYDTQDKLYNPLEASSYQVRMQSQVDNESLHIEFKAPKKLIDRAVSDNPQEISSEFNSLLRLWNNSKPNNNNFGKFNYIMKQN